MKERTALTCVVAFTLCFVQYSFGHDYKAGSLSGTGSQSFSSASASSYASSSAFSSSNSFGGKTGDLINEIASPPGNLLNGVKTNAQASAQAGTGVGFHGFANAGAEAGANVFGTGANSKATSGAIGFTHTSGTHGLGVDGGIGLDGTGSIEGTGKYGSAAIKGNCGGLSCLNEDSDVNTGGSKFGGYGSSGSGVGFSGSPGSAGVHENPSLSGSHGLGVGGGIGLDGTGSIEGTGKYGSAAIIGNCGGLSCLNEGSDVNAGGSKFGGSGSSGSDIGFSGSAGSAGVHENPSFSSSHGLGVGGGIGLDSTGSIEGTGKYGSAAIKGNCGGLSCLSESSDLNLGGSKFEGSGNYGSSGIDIGFSGNTGSAGAPESSTSKYGGFNSFDGIKKSGDFHFASSGAYGDSKSSTGCGTAFNPCTDNMRNFGKDANYFGHHGNSAGTVGVGATSGSAGANKDKGLGCDISLPGCGTNVAQYPLLKPANISPGFATGSIQVVKPEGSITGESLLCTNSNCGSGATDYHRTPITTGGIVPGYFTQSSTPSSGFLDTNVKVVKPSIGVISSVPGTIPTTAIHYSGPFPGPSLTIHHSIPASSVPSKPKWTATTAGVGASVNSNVYTDSEKLGSNVGSGMPVSGPAITVTEGHYAGPFPGPSGSIDKSKPASTKKPTIAEESHTIHAITGANANAQAEAGSSSGHHYTGTFPGPAGSIYQSKPAFDEKPSISQKESTAITGADVNGKAAAAAATAAAAAASSYGSHYTGTFPGPSGNIHQSTVPGPSIVIHEGTKTPSPTLTSSTPGISESHYPRPGSTPTVYKSPSIASSLSSDETYSQVGSSATTGTRSDGASSTTVYTEKPIINIIPISQTTEKSYTPEKATVKNYDKNTETDIGYIDSDCSHGKCSSPIQPVKGCDGTSCEINYQSVTPNLPLPYSGSAGICSDKSCTQPPTQTTVEGSNGAGLNTYSFSGSQYSNNLPHSGCSGSLCGAAVKELETIGTTGDSVNIAGNAPYINCNGKSCGNSAVESGKPFDSAASQQSLGNQGGGNYAVANAASSANAGNSNGIGCTSASCGTKSTELGGQGQPASPGCDGSKCAGGSVGSNAFSGSQSSSFAGSFSNAKSSSNSYSNVKSGASSHSFAGSSSSSGAFAVPLPVLYGSQSGAFSSSFANAGSSASSSSHY